ncbi:putative mucin/carbohydrate-binding domain-containing protein [Pseudomonas sp. stari2]|uniref:putative mucin/carbohydrate-binding domain-containing protein n=1 Tax=Pseudomonas sp. Stari2 TaxID=2954814 RepID=UPI00345D03F1
MSKGIYHDKQALGVILAPGTTIQIRHLSSKTDERLQLELLNDDEQTEEYLPFTGQTVLHTIKHYSVPFISTPHSQTETNIDVDIEYSSVPQPLPTYKDNSDAADFFRQWDEGQAPFALINTVYADILIPATDKALLKELHHSNNIKSISTYYQQLFEFFNLLAGLSFTPDTPTNKNSINRYFMKANKTGGGSAYYGHHHTAQSNGSVFAFWLDTRATNWGSLHEVGHGYQGLFMQNSKIHLGEVWNNIYAHYYQEKYLGEDIFKTGWLYNGNPEHLYNEVEQLFESNHPVNTWQLHEILFLLTLIFDTNADLLSKFNKEYRVLSNAPDFNFSDHPFTELIRDLCTRISNIDIQPLLSLVQIPMEDFRYSSSHYQNPSPRYPLYKLIPAEHLTNAIATLKLKNRFSIVDCNTLRPLNLVGKIELRLDQTLFSRIENRDLLIQNGSSVTYIEKITSPQITFSDIPAGPYTLIAPTTTSDGLQISTSHLIAITNNNPIELEYQISQGSRLASQIIKLNGLNGEFASINVDTEQKNITISVSSSAPHSYFHGKIYATITIRDTYQNMVFHKVLLGDDSKPSLNKIPFGYAYTLEIFHEEPSRNILQPHADKVLETSNKLTTLEITRQGLYNRALSTPTGEILATEIERQSEKIKLQPEILLHRNDPWKDSIFQAIDSYSTPEKNQLEETYKYLYSTHLNHNPLILTEKKINWDQYGLSGPFTKIDIDLELETAEIQILPTHPHTYFNSIYSAILAYNEKGNVVFCTKMHGNTLNTPSSTKIQFYEGCEIIVLHLESSRSPITNPMTNEQYPVEQRHRICALGNNRLQI